MSKRDTYVISYSLQYHNLQRDTGPYRSAPHAPPTTLRAYIFRFSRMSSSGLILCTCVQYNIHVSEIRNYDMISYYCS